MKRKKFSEGKDYSACSNIRPASRPENERPRVKAAIVKSVQTTQPAVV